jgi:hypothetical protein
VRLRQPSRGSRSSHPHLLISSSTNSYSSRTTWDDFSAEHVSLLRSHLSMWTHQACPLQALSKGSFDTASLSGWRHLRQRPNRREMLVLSSACQDSCPSQTRQRRYKTLRRCRCGKCCLISVAVLVISSDMDMKHTCLSSRLLQCSQSYQTFTRYRIGTLGLL